MGSYQVSLFPEASSRPPYTDWSRTPWGQFRNRFCWGILLSARTEGLLGGYLQIPATHEH